MKVGGKDKEGLGKVSSREDTGEQTLMGGEKLTETFDKMLDTLVSDDDNFRCQQRTKRLKSTEKECGKKHNVDRTMEGNG